MLNREDEGCHRSSRSSIPIKYKTIKICVVVIALVACLSFVFLHQSNLTLLEIIRRRHGILPVNQTLIKSLIQKKPFHAFNQTHLWSLRLADENYRQLIRSIPCRVVNYDGGPHHKIYERIDQCQGSNDSEFFNENSIYAQKWIYDHQHPANCSDKRFAIIRSFAISGYGSIIHQVAWAFGLALSENRIAVFATPGNWLYGNCPSMTLDCAFLPITNCSIPSIVDGKRVVYIGADTGYWKVPIHPPVFARRSFTWYRSQLVFYLMRFNNQTLNYVENRISQIFPLGSVERYRPYIALYVRRSDKVTAKEMSQAYSLRDYFNLFDADARRANISTIYLNSEDPEAFKEFIQLNKEMNNYYRLLQINATRNVVFGSLTRMSLEERVKIVMDFLVDLYIEANADLHSGTLTSNWCRLVDEFRLVLGKTVPYYTPEQKYYNDWRR